MKVTVNDNHVFEIVVQSDRLLLNSEEITLDSISVGYHKFSVIHANRSFQVELVEENRSEKRSVVKVNGRIYQVQIEDQYDQLLKKLGLDSTQSNKVLEIKAPMPGLVLKVLVEPGQEIQKGDSLLVLEAMKMENMIKSPTSGTVSKILVKTGDKVEKNGLMIQFA